MTAVLISGVFVGLVYGLLAIGLIVVYRTSRIVNFAYGEMGMLCAFVYTDIRLGSDAALPQHRSVFLALPVALSLGAAIGVAMELAIARPLRNQATLNGLVGTIGVSLLILTFAVQRYGLRVRQPAPLTTYSGFRVGGLTISGSQLLILASAAVILTALGALYRFTSLGQRLRATAIDPEAAALVGVNTNAISTGTWALAGALSALSAILIAPLVAMSVLFMTLLTLRSFAAALVGGLTSLPGGFVAGLLLGVLEAVVAFKSPLGGVTDLVVAGGILALMLVRPAGLVRASY